MLMPRIIPILLLKDGGLYKGVNFKNHKYVGDPINAVKIFNDKEVDELIFLDITASRHKGPNFKLLADIATEAFMPFAYGGGVRTIADIKELFNLGVEKVIINTAAIENPHFLAEAADKYGSQSVIAAVDVKKNFFGEYAIYSHSGTKKTRLPLMHWLKQLEDLGVGEVLLNAIDRDGTLKGYDLALAGIASTLTIPVILAGGAAHLNDFSAAVQVGVSAVAAGSMFVFHGVHKAVLIQYPSSKEIAALWEYRDER